LGSAKLGDYLTKGGKRILFEKFNLHFLLPQQGREVHSRKPDGQMLGFVRFIYQFCPPIWKIMGVGA